MVICGKVGPRLVPKAKIRGLVPKWVLSSGNVSEGFQISRLSSSIEQPSSPQGLRLGKRGELPLIGGLPRSS